MTSILLHTCCAPCATYTVRWLRDHGFEVTSYWYNPNIHPFTEHEKRLDAARSFASQIDLPLIVDEGYAMVDYFRAVAGHEEQRCADCYRMRLGNAARIAHERGFDAFTSTLLISPYQDQQLIGSIGRETGETNDVEFYFHDFTGGFRQSQQLARELDLYRQKYCGCVYSEWERFAKVKTG